MAIIIKEITVKTVIEENISPKAIGEKEKQRLKTEIVKEVKDLLKKEQLRNIRR